MATGRLYVHVRTLEHAEHNRADKGECNIHSYNAKPADERTYEIHWEGSLRFTSCPQLTIKVSKAFQAPKSQRYCPSASPPQEAGAGNMVKKP